MAGVESKIVEEKKAPVAIDREKVGETNQIH